MLSTRHQQYAITDQASLPGLERLSRRRKPSSEAAKLMVCSLNDIVPVGGASENTRKDFLGEAHMMAQFKHPNVMGLLGVVTASHPVMVIIQFMPNGSLKTYLKR